MNIRQRIIAIAVLLMILPAMLFVPMATAKADTVPWNEYEIGSVWDVPGAIKNFFWDNGIKRAYTEIFGWIAGVDDEKAPSEIEQAVVQAIQNDYGTTQFGRGGYIVPLRTQMPPTYGDSILTNATYPAWSTVLVTNGYSWISGWGTAAYDVYGGSSYIQYTLPQTSYVSLMYDFDVATQSGLNLSFVPAFGIGNSQSRQLHAIGQDVTLSPDRLEFSRLGDYSFYVRFRACLYVEPVAFNLADVMQDYGGSNGRMGNVDVEYATKQGSAISNVYDQRIINETNNTYYNPTTNETHNLTDWFYDYSTRSYTVTTENNETYVITYGDEHITIAEGSTTYNYYYVYEINGDGNIIGNDNDGNNSNNNNNNSGGGNGGSSDDDSGGIWGWLKDLLKRGVTTILNTISDLVEIVLQPVLDWIIRGIEYIGKKIGEILGALMEIVDVVPRMIGKYAEFISAFWAAMPPAMQMIVDMIALSMIAMLIIAIIKTILR